MVSVIGITFSELPANIATCVLRPFCFCDSVSTDLVSTPYHTKIIHMDRCALPMLQTFHPYWLCLLPHPLSGYMVKGRAIDISAEF